MQNESEFYSLQSKKDAIVSLIAKFQLSHAKRNDKVRKNLKKGCEAKNAAGSFDNICIII
jgi:hypothetical protein